MKRVLLVLTLAGCLWADEGMWLYNQFPKEQVAKKYGFQVTDDFLKHLQLSSVRLGASGSFVSPKGLIFTNHHVASGCIQKLSTKEHNYMANGFYAATEADELKCPDTEATVLLRIDDVTNAVNAGVKAKPGAPEANRERRAVIASLEKDCGARTGNRCEVVTLYSGAMYNLYEYKKYTDVRLVFAPEEAIAFFGGDPDNFTYPRYDMDITFLRAYENGRPVNSPNYLKWSRQGVRDGELAFVSGNPASTDRFITYSELAYLRDTDYPLSLDYFGSAIKALKAFGAQGEQARRSRQALRRREHVQGAHLGVQGPADREAVRGKEGARRPAACGDREESQAEAGRRWRV